MEITSQTSGEATFFNSQLLTSCQRITPQNQHRITSQKKMFGRASPGFSLEAATGALPNNAYKQPFWV